MSFELWAQNGPRNHEPDSVQIPNEKGQFLGKGSPILKCRDFSAESCAKTAEPIDVSFMLWTRVGRRKHKFNHIHQVVPMCLHGRTHWRHLANALELSVRGGDAVLCQITLAACSCDLDRMLTAEYK